MSDVGANPFSDPRLRDPFQDPSVALASQTSAPVLEESNPFTEAKLPPKMAGPSINTQPAIMKPTEEPPAYSQHHPQEPLRAAAELLRRQDELERKAAELDRREREMRSLSASGGRKKNWPPLPEKFPIGPCFYNDTTVDIPVEFQKTVKLMYYLWMFHSWALFTNVLGCLAWFYVDPSRGMDFGLAIIWFMLFTPFSFVCWYRPLYGAFRSGSSFRFFVFFFVYICQFGIYVLQSIGIAGWGASGWISALMGLNQNVPVGVFMIVIAALFSSLAVLSLIMYKRVHGMYRSTGASFAKAQQELASSVMANKTVQAAVASAASRPSRGTFKEQI